MWYMCAVILACHGGTFFGDFVSPSFFIADTKWTVLMFLFFVGGSGLFLIVALI